MVASMGYPQRHADQVEPHPNRTGSAHALAHREQVQRRIGGGVELTAPESTTGGAYPFAR
jgi:hypothetical protein